MGAGKIIAWIAAAILIFFGVLFIWGAFSPDGQVIWILIGLVSVAIGLGIIWFTARHATTQAGSSNNVTLKIDLPANVNMDTLKCTSCGGVLSTDDIKMVAGAPVVNCPYCKTTYQLTEEPKW
jgi:phage FluMu protein Com